MEEDGIIDLEKILLDHHFHQDEANIDLEFDFHHLVVVNIGLVLIQVLVSIVLDLFQ